MLLVASSDEDPVVRSDSLAADHQVWTVVPLDKHVALRNLHVVTGPAPPPDGAPGAYSSTLLIHNPFPHHQFFDIVVDRGGLPLDWRLLELLPDVRTRAGLRHAGRDGVRVGRITKADAWALPAAGHGDRPTFAYAARVEPASEADCGR